MFIYRQARITLEVARFGWIVRNFASIDAKLTIARHQAAFFVALWRLGDHRHISAVLC